MSRGACGGAGCERRFAQDTKVAHIIAQIDWSTVLIQLTSPSRIGCCEEMHPRRHFPSYTACPASNFPVFHVTRVVASLNAKHICSAQTLVLEARPCLRAIVSFL